MFIGISVNIYGLFRRFVGNITPEPLGPPRLLTYLEDTTAPDGGVSFSWQPPTSFGQAGPSATNRFGYQVRVGMVGGTLSPWTGTARLNTNTVRIAWTQASMPEMMEFRVAAFDANGVASAWLTSPVLREGDVQYPPPTGLSFTQVPGEFTPVTATWMAPARAGIVALSGYRWRYRSRGPGESPYSARPRMGWTTPTDVGATVLSAEFSPWLDSDTTEMMEFQVAALYTDGGVSRWLDSGGVITEGTIPAPPSTGGRFAGRFSGRFS